MRVREKGKIYIFKIFLNKNCCSGNNLEPKNHFNNKKYKNNCKQLYSLEVFLIEIIFRFSLLNTRVYILNDVMNKKLFE